MAQALVIGICGGTGAGKTTLAQRIVSALPDGNILVLQLEHYYKDFTNLPLDCRGKQNFDHPESFDLRLLIQNVRDLREGIATDRPVYDFARHQRRPLAERTEPRAVVVVEGILVFEPQALRDLIDFKIFVDTPADARFIRRMQRDVQERGKTIASVVDQYLAAVRPMHHEFVEPSKRHADLVVQEGGYGAGGDLAIEKIQSLLAAAGRRA